MKGLIFTWLLTLVGVSSSFITPYYGFLAYVALAILRPDSLWSSHISGGRFSLIVAGGMLLSWIFRCCGNWDLGPARRVVTLLVGSWLWAVFLSLQADSPTHAWYYVEQQAKILLPFLVGITSVRNISDLRKLAWTIVVCEGYVAMEMNRWYFSGYNYLWHIGFGGVDNNSAAIGLVTALGVAFFLFLNEEKFWKKGIIAFCAAFIGHAILFSFSRGAMLACVIFAGVSFVIIKKTTVHYMMFGAGLLAALMLAGPQVRDRFLETFAKQNGVREASAQSRIDLWKDCGELLMRNPIMGCGPDHWPLHAHEFGWEKGKEAHSLWVQTTCELGIPGIIMFMGFYLVTIWRSWLLLRRTKSTDDVWFTDAARMTIASLIGFMVAAQFVSLEALEIPYYVALMGAGSLAVHSRMYRDGRTNPPSATMPVEGAPASVAASAVLIDPVDGTPEITVTQSEWFEDQPLMMNRRFMIREPELTETEPTASSTDWRDQIDGDSGVWTNETDFAVMN